MVATNTTRASSATKSTATVIRTAGYATTALAALLLSGCACPLDHVPPGVRWDGQPAEGADRVLAVAAAHCGRDLRGTVTWLPAEPFMCGSVQAAGCEYSGCHFEAQVARIEPATKSALAHEIGHYCLRKGEGPEVEAFAATVNAEAAAP